MDSWRGTTDDGHPVEGLVVYSAAGALVEDAPSEQAACAEPDPDEPTAETSTKVEPKATRSRAATSRTEQPDGGESP